MRSDASEIHPTASVSAEASIADGVRIGAFATVEAGARIAAGCVLRERAHVCADAILGENCVLHMNAVVGHTPQDFSYKGGPVRTRLGRNVTVRENATVHGSARSGDAEGTLVGDDCYLMVGSHVAHDCVLGRGVILANGALLAGHVEVQDGAFISGNVVIHQFVKIGRLAMLSGGSRFGMDVPPFMIGDGANCVTVLNAVGLRRSPNLSEVDRRELRAAYKILYRQELALDAALARLESEFQSPAVRQWVEFFRRPSKRGFCRFRGGGRRAGESDE